MTSPAPAIVDDDLAAALGAELAARWSIPRGPQPPAVRVARVDGRPVAAVLATRRSATLATTIAEAWHEAGCAGAESALERLVEELLADARERGDVAVKWRDAGDLPLPERLGFAPMRMPYRSATGTEGVTGRIRWLRSLDHDEPPYYSQTSTFTCGAVTALLASELRGSGGFADDGGDRDREVDFWRRASNYPTCEPIGLAVALRESFDDPEGTAPVEVFLDLDGPVLLESYTERFDRAFRTELQEQSLRKALASDVGVRRDRVGVDEIAARIEGGELALMLIDLEPMYGFSVPHWVLGHAAADGVVVIEDPWIAASWGETWVDAHELPIALADLDRMLAWGVEGYRGVVFIRRD
jgi:hypothetical protein